VAFELMTVLLMVVAYDLQNYVCFTSLTLVAEERGENRYAQQNV
jgi:hypothetical protein